MCTDFSATVPATVPPPPPLWSLDEAKLYSIPLVILLGELVTVVAHPPGVVEDEAAAGVLLAPRREEEEDAPGPPLREGVTDGDVPTSTVDARLYPLLERLA